MKCIRAVEFRDLPDMSEIVIGPFMEHFAERDGSKLRMHSGASAGGCRQPHK
jgi:hypothetical protein